MANPSFRSQANVSCTPAGTTFSAFAAPAGISAGDIGILQIGWDANPGAITTVGDGNWTLIHSGNVGSSYYAAYKRTMLNAGGDSTNFVWTNNAVALGTYWAVASADIALDFGGAGATGNVASPQILPAQTVVTLNSFIAMFEYHQAATSISGVNSINNGATLWNSARIAPSEMGAAYKANLAVGSTGAFNFVNTDTAADVDAIYSAVGLKAVPSTARGMTLRGVG